MDVEAGDDHRPSKPTILPNIGEGNEKEKDTFKRRTKGRGTDETLKSQLYDPAQIEARQESSSMLNNAMISQEGVQVQANGYPKRTSPKAIGMMYRSVGN